MYKLSQVWENGPDVIWDSIYNQSLLKHSLDICSMTLAGITNTLKNFNKNDKIISPY